MKTVAACNEIAGQLNVLSILSISNLRLRTIEVMHADIFNFKQDLAPGRNPGIIKVFQHLMLRVNRDPFSASKFLKIDAVTAAAKAQLNPIVNQAFGFHPFASTHFREQVNGSLLQHARAHSVL